MPRSGRELAAGAVVLVSLLAAACTSSAPPAAGFVGHRWQVVRIHGPRHDVPLPVHLHVPVFLSFGRSGRLEAGDAVNRYRHLRYSAVPGGYQATGYRGTLGWYVDKAADRVSVAVVSVLDGPVHAEMDGPRLHLSADGYEVICVRRR